MKFIWSDLDIKPGRIVVSANGAKEQWQIGYTYDPTDHDQVLKVYTLNSLDDGLVNIYRSQAKVAEALNGNYIPIQLKDWVDEH